MARLADTYSKRGFETAIRRELERFLLELRSDCAFVARQKRIIVGTEGFYLHLLVLITPRYAIAAEG